ncbi:hypothetical protein Cfor_01960 [Coptotermes formosanus]|uniref:Reverse transcriptase domain-containing protein n=1 Tax=Coptotermes formosanus TaxID=36987 RepID=A0A6L2PZN8_COPFO|nr:hypothetical protein Cfor_01960 [Coptotermes formosanus]
MAFADDLFLLANNRENAIALLAHTEDYLSRLGMQISASKCSSFQITPTKDSWYLKDAQLRLRNGEVIPACTADDSVTYLGGRVSPWFGITYKHIVADMRSTFHRLRAAPLKPHQKLSLLTTYIIPHYLHKTSIAAPPITTIRAIDDEIRTIVKDILHLPANTPNGLLYTGKRDGGLGIPKLETLAICNTLKQGILFLNSLDPVAQAVASATQLEGRLQRMAKCIRLQWPGLTFQQIDSHKKKQKQVELNNWKSLSSKGKGAHSFANDRLGNAWLYNPRLLKPSRFLTALRLRGCVTADKVTLNKAIPQASTKCRKCKVSQETLGHILGQCIHTKAQRIRRQNEIRDIVSSRLAKSTDISIIEEATLQTPEGTNLKPDLVIVNQGRVHVVDVTVRHEDGGNLTEGHRSKIEKYSSLLETLAGTIGVRAGKVLPVVVGTRGALPESTILSLRDLGIDDRHTYITIALTVLRSSIEVYHGFLDYDKPRRGTPQTDT